MKNKFYNNNKRSNRQKIRQEAKLKSVLLLFIAIIGNIAFSNAQSNYIESDTIIALHIKMNQEYIRSSIRNDSLLGYYIYDDFVQAGFSGKHYKYLNNMSLDAWWGFSKKIDNWVEATNNLLCFDYIEKLDLPGYGLDAFPIELTAIKNVKNLYITTKGLRKTPSEMKNMTGVEFVWMTNNLSGLNCKELDSLFEGLYCLPNLKELYITDTQLDSIPESFLRFEKLEVLHIDGSNLKYIPDAIFKIKRLESLTIDYIPEIFNASFINCIEKPDFFITFTIGHKNYFQYEKFTDEEMEILRKLYPKIDFSRVP